MFKISRKLISDRSNSEKRTVARYLQSNFNLFSNIERDELEQIANKLIPVTYKRGQKILKEGDYGDFLVVLYSGRVNVLRS